MMAGWPQNITRLLIALLIIGHAAIAIGWSLLLIGWGWPLLLSLATLIDTEYADYDDGHCCQERR